MLGEFISAMCNIFDDKVMTTEEWKANHIKHLGPPSDFKTEPFMPPHEDWEWLICPCGAKTLNHLPEGSPSHDR